MTSEMVEHSGGEVAKISNLINWDNVRKSSQSSASFLAYLKLMQDLSPETKDEETGFKAGDWALGRHNLTKECGIVVLAVRNHALHLRGNSKVTESFRADSPIYIRLENIGSVPKGEQVMVGSDWLIYVPSIKKFCTYLTGKTSNRQLGWDIADHMEPPDQRSEGSANVDMPYTNCFKLKAFWDDRGPTYKCWAPKIVPLEPHKSMIPLTEDLEKAVALFNAPVENEPHLEESDSVER